MGSNFSSASYSGFLQSVHWKRNWVILTWKVGSNFSSASDSTFSVKMTQFFLSEHLAKKLSHFDLKSWVEFQFRQWLNFLSQLSWVETKSFKLKRKTFIVLVTQRVTGSLVLLLKLLISKIHQNYCDIHYILKWFWKNFKIIWFSMWFWFSNHDFQNDFEFDFKSPLFRWFDFDFKIINIWWFCPSLTPNRPPPPPVSCSTTTASPQNPACVTHNFFNYHPISLKPLH